MRGSRPGSAAFLREPVSSASRGPAPAWRPGTQEDRPPSLSPQRRLQLYQERGRLARPFGSPIRGCTSLSCDVT